MNLHEQLNLEFVDLRCALKEGFLLFESASDAHIQNDLNQCGD